MKEKLNIAEILEDAPTGTLLYSPIFGELAYIGCHAYEGQTYSIIVCQYPDAIGQGNSVSVEFDENGTYLNRGYSSRRGGECMLFPSKENRDWSTFKVTEKHKRFEPFEKVLVKVIFRTFPKIIRKWIPDIYLFYDEENSCHRVAVNNYLYNDGDIIPFSDNENKVGKIVE